MTRVFLNSEKITQLGFSRSHPSIAASPRRTAQGNNLAQEELKRIWGVKYQLPPNAWRYHIIITLNLKNRFHYHQFFADYQHFDWFYFFRITLRLSKTLFTCILVRGGLRFARTGFSPVSSQTLHVVYMSDRSEISVHLKFGSCQNHRTEISVRSQKFM